MCSPCFKVIIIYEILIFNTSGYVRIDWKQVAVDVIFMMRSNQAIVSLSTNMSKILFQKRKFGPSCLYPWYRHVKRRQSCPGQETRKIISKSSEAKKAVGNSLFSLIVRISNLPHPHGMRASSLQSFEVLFQATTSTEALCFYSPRKLMLSFSKRRVKVSAIT